MSQRRKSLGLFFYLFLYLYLLSRHTCAGIFCFYLESGEVLRKKMDGSVLVSPGWEVATKRKDTKEKTSVSFGAEGETRQGLPCLFAARTIPLYVPFCCAKRWTIAFSSLPGGKL